MKMSTYYYKSNSTDLEDESIVKEIENIIELLPENDDIMKIIIRDKNIDIPYIIC
jgi:hypothetical protein